MVPSSSVLRVRRSIGKRIICHFPKLYACGYIYPPHLTIVLYTFKATPFLLITNLNAIVVLIFPGEIARYNPLGSDYNGIYDIE